MKLDCYQIYANSIQTRSEDDGLCLQTENTEATCVVRVIWNFHVFGGDQIVTEW